MPQILVVEDQRIVAEDIRENLEHLGYAVSAIASSGKEAIQKAEEVLPDLIMMDIRLKGKMDGIETAEYINQRLDVPVVYLTAFADEDTLQRAKQTQPFGYLIKPFKERELHTTIEVALYKHEMEVQLKELQDHLAKAQRIAHLGHWNWDIQTHELAWSDEIYRIFGLPPQEFETTYENFLQCVHPEDRVFVERSVEEALQKKPFDIEHRIVLPDGEVRVVNERGEVSFDPAGQPIRMLGTMQDITERKRQEALQRARQRVLDEVWKMNQPEDIQQVLEAVKAGLEMLGVPFQGCGINVVDTSGKSSAVCEYETSDQGTWEVEEKELGEFLGLIWRSGKPHYRCDLEAEDPSQERKILEQKFGTVHSVLDVPFSHGTLAVNSPKAHAFSEEDIQSLQILAEVLSEGFRRLDDLKALEATEEQLRQSQKMEAVGQLAGGVAHDFNNLITVITGYCQLLMKGLDRDGKPYKNVEQIKRSGERAATLVRQLLAFSRRQIMQPEVLDLNQVVADMDKMLQRLIREDVELVSTREPELGKVEADPGQLEQVIMNLVVNACDAMPQGGKLTLETANVELDAVYAQQHVEAQPGAYVMLAVSDTGVGMDAETQSRIFEPFFTTKEQGGTGLGLSTVYGIVQQSNGHIEVYSEPGEGTTFKIYLPRVEKDRTLPPRPLSVEPADLEGMETVLVVEDDETVRELVQRILLDYGYVILEARCGEEALSISGQHPGPIHLLLTDVVMPGMNGRELAEQLTALRPEMKVMYMSGYADHAISRHGLVDTEVSFLQKPFSPEDLGREVRETLDRPQYCHEKS